MKRFIPPFLMLASLSVLIVFAAEIKTDYNHSADFSVYRSYSGSKQRPTRFGKTESRGRLTTSSRPKAGRRYLPMATPAWLRSVPHTNCRRCGPFMKALAVVGFGGPALATASPRPRSRKRRSEP